MSMKTLYVILVSLCLLSCADNDDSWWEKSRALKARKKARVKELMKQGYSEQEALDTWRSEISIEQTEGRETLTLEGDELDRVLSD